MREVPFTPHWWNLPQFFPIPGAMAFSEHLLGLSLIATPVIWATGNALLGRLEARGRRFPRLWIDVTLPRTRAIVLAAEGDVRGALAALDELDLDAARLLPFDLAWTLLVRGRLHRRARQRRAAADALGAALEIFEELGAPVWSE